MEAAIKKTHKALTIFFIFSAILFVCIYFPLTYQNCKETINRVNDYVEGVDCFCNRNVGFNKGSVMKMTSQSETILSLGGTGNGEEIVINGTTYIINLLPLGVWGTYYYSYSFGNKITKVEFDALSFYDPLELIPDIRTELLCSIVIGSNSKTFFRNESEACEAELKKSFPDFQRHFMIDYNNQNYRDICGGISYCEIRFCPTYDIVNIFLFCGSITTSLYTIIRIIKYASRLAFERYAKRKIEMDTLEPPNYQAV